jgi:tRNA(fMet)-specific endonuclease VapC
MRWMLDTDSCITFLKGTQPQAFRRITAGPLGEVGLSSIALAELYAGIAKSERSHESANVLFRSLALLEIVAFDEPAAAVYGAIRARLERRGTTIGPLDLLIAAHAMSANATLVTHNTREFERLADLRVEDWIAELT